MHFIAVALWLAFVSPAAAADTNACAEHLPYGMPALPSSLHLTLVCHRGYAAMHDDEMLVPRWVAYHLTGPHTLGCIARGNNFHADDDLPKDRRASPSDYARSGYDKGHMAPAQDFAWAAEVMSDSFSMVNMAPQVPGLNRAQWLRLEESVRAYAFARGEVIVYVGPVLGDDPKTIGRGKVAVPQAFWKVIVDPAKAEAIAFAMPQQAIPKGDLAPWQFTISDVDRSARATLPLPEGVERSKRAPLWSADLKGWNAAHRRACKR